MTEREGGIIMGNEKITTDCKGFVFYIQVFNRDSIVKALKLMLF